MISSISNSDVDSALAEPVALSATRRALRIALVLLLVLVAVEALTRWKFIRMSKEFEQFGSYPARAAELATVPGVRVAVLGASIVHEDVDSPLLAKELQATTDRPLHVEPFSADHSYVNTWHYMLQQYFWRPGNQVDMVVVPFVGQSLYDGNEIEIGRLARYFTDVADWPEVLRTDMTTTAERADFLVSSGWVSFAARDRMQELAFTLLLPDYKGYATAQQAAWISHQNSRSGGPRRRQPTTQVFERLVSTARAHNTRLVFVAFPSLHSEWTDPYDDLHALIDRYGMAYLDLRQVADVDADSFVDQVHMNADGRTAFTRRLAQSLVPLLRPEAATAEAAPAVPQS
jgi:hypothetical protein